MYHHFSQCLGILALVEITTLPLSLRMMAYMVSWDIDSPSFARLAEIC